MTDLRPLRQQILRVATNAGEGHVPSALSILDIVYVLHNEMVRDNSRLILSKGHGCLALYVVLAHFGRLWQDWESVFCEEGGLLGHPERDTKIGIEATTGSLGHGIGMAVGVALGLRIKQQSGRVFCIVGDGECEEGEVWSSALLAARHQLGNLIVMVDANGTSPNRVDGVRHETCLASKFRAFGWFVSRVNGHDHDALRKAVCITGNDRPIVIICDTTKGYGVKTMSDSPSQWHHRVPVGVAELNLILSEVASGSV